MTEQPVKPPHWDDPLERVEGATFAGGTVAVDGKHFVRCHFQGVTFHYDGVRPAAFDQVTFAVDAQGHTHTRLTTTNPAILGTVILLRLAGLLKEPT